MAMIIVMTVSLLGVIGWGKYLKKSWEYNEIEYYMVKYLRKKCGLE